MVCVIPMMLIVITGVITAEETGYITITSEPSSVDVWIDNIPAGQTPLQNRPVTSGSHIIRLLDKSTQRTITEPVTIIKDSSMIIHIPLLNKYGALTVDTDPPGAVAEFVTHVGNTPVKAQQLVPGAYTLRLRHPKKKYQPIIKNVFIPESAVQSVKESFPENRSYMTRKWIRIAFGAAGVGLYSWGFIESANDHIVPSITGFSLGTLCILGIEIIAFL